MKKMNINKDVIDKADKDKLFDLLTNKQLPLSQAVVVHFCDDLKWRQCDVSRLLDVSYMAVGDALRKGRQKLEE